MKMRVKIADILIILLTAGITVYSAVLAYARPKGEARVLIRAQGREWTFPTNTDETIFVPGPLGEDTVIRISSGSAWVESSPCENQTCVASGRLARQGQWAACLPNNVLLMIDGKGIENEDIDTAAW